MDLDLPTLSFENININYMQSKKPVHTVSTHHTDQSFNPKQSLIKQKIISNHIDVDFYLKTQPVITKYTSKHQRAHTQKLVTNELQKGEKNGRKYLSNSVYTKQKDLNSTKSTQRSAMQKNSSKNKQQSKPQSKSLKIIPDHPDHKNNCIYQIPINANSKMHSQHNNQKKKKKQPKKQQNLEYGIIIENSNEQSNIKPQNYNNKNFQANSEAINNQKHPRTEQLMLQMIKCLENQKYQQLQKYNNLISRFLFEKKYPKPNKTEEQLIFLLKFYNQLVTQMINKNCFKIHRQISESKLMRKLKQLQTKNYNYCQIYNKMKQQGINVDEYAYKTLS